MLTLRTIGPNDYRVHEDGLPIGRIRYARERVPGIWLWHITVTIPGGVTFGDASTIDEAKARFKVAWIAFKDQHGPERLARAYEAMAHANRPGRYGRYWRAQRRELRRTAGTSPTLFAFSVRNDPVMC